MEDFDDLSVLLQLLQILPIADGKAAKYAAPIAVVSTVSHCSTGISSRSAWNCMMNSLREAPPSTDRRSIESPTSCSMARSTS